MFFLKLFLLILLCIPFAGVLLKLMSSVLDDAIKSMKGK